MSKGVQDIFKEKLQQQFKALQGTKKGLYVSSDAFEKFLKNGVPNVKQEEWKYTNIESALRYDYHIAEGVDVTIESISSLIPFEDCHRIIFVNGFYNEMLSSILPDEALEVNALNRITNPSAFTNKASVLLPDNGWTYLNDAIIREGISIRVHKGKQVSAPVLILHIISNANVASLMQYRHLIHLEANSGVTIIEAHYAFGHSEATLTNVSTQIQLDRDARLTHIKLQDLQNGATPHHTINYTAIWQDENAHSQQYTFSLSGELIRNNLHIQLAGKYSEALLFGLYTPHRKEVIDNHTLVDHAVSHCHSNELYKGIADDASKAVFNGKILVRKDAQKTNAFQSNKNLVLTHEAAVYTKPQLEIFADDVKCSHGATSGQLDEEALFYLKARGIREPDARKMLMLAFAEDVTASIQDERLREWLNQYIERKLS